MQEITGVDFELKYGGNPLQPDEKADLKNPDGQKYTVGTLPLAVNNLDGAEVTTVKVTGDNIDSVTIIPVDVNGVEGTPVRGDVMCRFINFGFKTIRCRRFFK